MKASLTAHEIVVQWLDANGFDGLASDECACDIADLAPCGNIGPDCQAGYKASCPGGEECDGDGECDFHILPERRPGAPAMDKPHSKAATR